MHVALQKKCWVAFVTGAAMPSKVAKETPMLVLRAFVGSCRVTGTRTAALRSVAVSPAPTLEPFWVQYPGVETGPTRRSTPFASLSGRCAMKPRSAGHLHVMQLVTRPGRPDFPKGRFQRKQRANLSVRKVPVRVERLANCGSQNLPISLQVMHLVVTQPPSETRIHFVVGIAIRPRCVVIFKAAHFSPSVA